MQNSTAVSVKVPVLSVVNGLATTTSINVADYFGKRHTHVIDAIKSIDVPEGVFSQPIFRPRDYIDERGKIQPMYEMTRDGFVFLVMGFTGKKAAQFKWTYISAFNKMETELFRRTGGYQVPKDMKRCSKCRQIFPRTKNFFHSDVSRYDGLDTYCRNCCHKIARRYQKRRIAIPAEKRLALPLPTPPMEEGALVEKIRGLVKAEVEMALKSAS